MPETVGTLLRNELRDEERIARLRLCLALLEMRLCFETIIDTKTTRDFA